MLACVVQGAGFATRDRHLLDPGPWITAPLPCRSAQLLARYPIRDRIQKISLRRYANGCSDLAGISAPCAGPPSSSPHVQWAGPVAEAAGTPASKIFWPPWWPGVHDQRESWEILWCGRGGCSIGAEHSSARMRMSAIGDRAGEAEVSLGRCGGRYGAKPGGERERERGRTRAALLFGPRGALRSRERERERERGKKRGKNPYPHTWCSAKEICCKIAGQERGGGAHE